jgi:chromosome segregation ATPase
LAELGYTRAQAEASIHREQAAQAEKHLGALKEDVDQLQSKSLALQSALHTLQTENAILQRENATLQSENAILQGSLRHFMRAYLPRLRQHLFGQRP